MSRPRYFPPDYSSKIGCYADSLELFEEPILWDGSSGIQAGYRFCTFPSFLAPQTIRLEKRHNQYRLIIRRPKYFGQHRRGKPIVEEISNLNEATWQKFQRLVQAFSFYKMPIEIEERMFLVDGTRYIMEGFSEKKYHAVIRNTNTFSMDREFVHLTDALQHLQTL